MVGKHENPSGVGSKHILYEYKRKSSLQSCMEYDNPFCHFAFIRCSATINRQNMCGQPSEASCNADCIQALQAALLSQ
jgi:hypothetical protein